MSPEQRTVVVVLLGVLLMGSVYAYLRDNVFVWAGAIDLGQPETNPQITVHVAGAVMAPGVYHLSKGARVQDALAAAGGLSPQADADALNLASLLIDGQRVNAPERFPEEPTATGGQATADPRININTASERDLESLPGVGPQTAKRITEFRKANGKFASVEDLTKVPGIGDKTLERLRPLIKAR